MLAIMRNDAFTLPSKKIVVTLQIIRLSYCMSQFVLNYRGPPSLRGASAKISKGERPNAKTVLSD